MSKRLAIRGHSTRGKEVIELLEMMGGENKFDYIGGITMFSYYVSGQVIYTDNTSIIEYDDFVIFTLEDFLAKYPFKVGDKVVYTKFGDNCDDYPVIIESMKWTGTTIEYTFNDCVTCLAKDLKMWTGEPDVAISGIYLNSCDYADEVELNLGDYEIEVRDGRTFAVKKKSKYPTTYEECCKILDYCGEYFLTTYDAGCVVNKKVVYEILQQVNSLTQLLICKLAYWKIAGEQMGLDKPWEPDLENEELYCIQNYNKQITISRTNTAFNKILIFPTEEMRDVFYENFKDLIEQCKELL